MNLFDELYQCIEEHTTWDKHIVLKRNEYLCMPGSQEHYMYYIVSGSLKIFIVDDYAEHIIRFGYRENFVTALDSFLSGGPTDFYMQALKKTELKAISKHKFMSLFDMSSEHKAMWDRILTSFVIQQIEREKDILISSPLERYQRVFRRSPQLFQEVPLKYIASYLRMSPETLSRIRNS